MRHKYQMLLLIGLPGSGKSTQGKMLHALPEESTTGKQAERFAPSIPIRTSVI